MYKFLYVAVLELIHVPWRMVSLGSGVVVRQLFYILAHGTGVNKG
jgi:hypothetical protein